MFKVPTKLDYKTLRNVFNHPMYRRIMLNTPCLKLAARRRGVFARLNMEVQ